MILLPLLMPRYVSIRKIDCISQYGSCNSSLNDSISKVKKGNMIDTDNNLKNVLENNIFVKEYRMRYSFPDKLILNVIERNPSYALTDSSFQKYLLLDKSGLILNEVDMTSLPTIIVDEIRLKPGDRVEKNQLFALNIIQSIYTTYKPKSAKIENNSLLVELEDNLKIIFPLEGENDLLVGSMFFILSKLKKDEAGVGNIAVIDLTYKSPVLTLR
jgi:cell division septal protein FtsQ